MRLGLSCLAVVLAGIAASWAWLGQPVPMPQSPLAPGDKLYCLSYAPFHGSQTPLDPATMISAAQIEADLTQLAKITDCVRTYSTDFGIGQVPAIAARLGLKVLQGLWLSTNAASNQEQIADAVRLANTYPGTIIGVVVGNEVLLRGEMSATDLAATIRSVKAQVKVPVTYADVWEFWLRNRDVAAAVDFITIHILPYWEDVPIPADQAAAHVEAIRARMAREFAPKEVIIGEVGWPSQGRMREGALPSPANQARVIQQVLAIAARDKFRVNVIEAFDAPWKRAQEGVVGGHWGLLDDATRQPKFQWGEPVSNHPQWKWQATGGMAFALLVFGAAYWARRNDNQTRFLKWLAVSANALSGGVLIGWTFANVPIESIGWGGWARSLALAAIAALAPVALSAATMRGTPTPRLSRLLGPVQARTRDPLAILVGVIAIATLLLAILTALGLVFDPRYRDFPFAPLTAVAVAFVSHSLFGPRPAGQRGATEIVGAAVLAGSVVYIVPNEGMAELAVALALRRAWCCWRSVLPGCATRQAEHQQADGQRRQRDIVEHNAETGSGQRGCEYHQRRPQQIERGQRQRGDPKHRMAEQHRHNVASVAQPAIEPGGTGQPDARAFDAEIAHVERIAERTKAHDQQDVGLAGARQKQLHRFRLLFGRGRPPRPLCRRAGPAAIRASVSFTFPRTARR